MQVKLNQFGYVFSMILKVLSHNLSSDVESIFPFTTNVFNHIFSCSYSCLDIFLALSAIDGWGLDLFDNYLDFTTAAFKPFKLFSIDT